ncbi:hypothetical protein LWE61_15080 [Sphingobium sufflavum]|nr:hypothetical protein [Sphingobium sufflavum]MCE7797872.1 hypothetical protein [Sphingobium sufflavum]
MISCPFTRDAVRLMLPVVRCDATIARRVSNTAYRVSPSDVRALRQRPR